MRPIARVVATAGLVVAAAVGSGATAALAQPVAGTVSTGIQAEGEVACGYDYGACWRQWYEYGFVKNYIVSEIYYRGGGYHFFWWN